MPRVRALDSVSPWPIATIVTLLAAIPVAALAQEPVRFAEPDPAQFSPNTLVTRFRIDPAVLEAVATTAELVSALREHLMVEASMPLDEPLRVTARWNVTNPQAGHPFTIESNQLAFDLEGGSAVVSDFASAVRASHQAETFSDWEEDAAWTWFREHLEHALAEPAMMMGLTPRERDESGYVRLGIAAVHSVPFGDEAYSLKDALERDYIELTPSPSFSSSALAGWEPPEGLTYDTEILLFELEPAPKDQALAELGEGLVAIELPPEALDRFAGSYEIQPNVILEVWREGGVLMSAPRDDKSDVATLTPFSGSEFWTDVDGTRAIIRFQVGDDGSVESMTIERPRFL